MKSGAVGSCEAGEGRDTELSEDFTFHCQEVRSSGGAYCCSGVERDRTCEPELKGARSQKNSKGL
jgi:hypothetical protein